MKKLCFLTVNFLLLAIGLCIKAEPTSPTPAQATIVGPKTKVNSPQQQAETAKNAPKTVQLGATAELVRAIMGSPIGQIQSRGRSIWMYECGSVEFKAGRVIFLNLLSDEELAARRIQDEWSAADAKKRKLQQQAEEEQQSNVLFHESKKNASQQASTQASRAYRKSVADRTYAQRKAAAESSYEKELARIENQYNDSRQRAIDYSNSVTASRAYNRGERMDAPKQLSSELASLSNSYSRDVEAAKSRCDASLKEAEANYKSDLENIDAVTPEQTINVRYE